MFASLADISLTAGRLDRTTLVVGVRLVCAAAACYNTLVISWQSVLSAVILIGSFCVLKPYSRATLSPKPPHPTVPDLLHHKPRLTGEHELPEQLLTKTQQAVCDLVLYPPENTPALAGFLPLRAASQCVFASRARLWGAPEWPRHIPLDEHVVRTVPTFLRFTCLCTHLGLDGFLFELPGQQYGSNVHEFGRSMRRLLQTLSDHDPSGFHCMDKSYITKRGWVFEFNKLTFFVTTFAPFYPDTHPRYAFGCNNCYVLFQPEISFAQHNIPSDTPETDWENPKTIRDKIRVAFREAGRPYRVRESVHYPVVEDIVKPMDDFSGQLIHWWEKTNYS